EDQYDEKRHPFLHFCSTALWVTLSMRSGIGYRSVKLLTIRKDFHFKLFGTAEYVFTRLDGEGHIVAFAVFTHTDELLDLWSKGRFHASTISWRPGGRCS